MSVTVTSTTDSAEAVRAATGSLQPRESKVEESKNNSASSESEESELQDETSEASDTSADEGDVTESTESDDDEGLKDESKEDEDKPAKKTKKLQKRFNKLTAKASLAEQRALKAEQDAQYWREQATKGKLPDEAKANQSSASEKPSIDSKPKAEQFDSHQEFVEALTDWKLDQKERDREVKQKESQLKSEYQKTLDAHQSRVDAFQKQTPDYKEVVTEFLEDHGDLKFSLGLEEIIMTTETGPALFYELAKNPDELIRINALPLVAQARELGKLETKLSKTTDEKQETKKQTKAPAPIAPVTSKGSAKINKDPENMSFQEYKTWRASQ